jgi:monooxygenase
MGDDESVTSATEHLDVLIIGAGLAGIGTACHLERELPGLTYAVLESRPVSGGTWDLFRYPGVRSDSDMFTLGYSFRPWATPKSIADGASILRYLRETAEEYGVTPKIRYGCRVVSASWSSSQARWLVSIEVPQPLGGREVPPAPVERALSCGFLHLSTGYYDYVDPYLPEFPGVERFTGELVHPQLWAPGTTWAGKDVVVIGSGATAVSILPAIAAATKSAVMLQRSPSYVISLPQRKQFSAPALARLSPKAASRYERIRSVTVTSAFWHLCRLAPARSADWLIGRLRGLLPPGYPLENFTPRYRPWDQRLCVVPDGDLLTAVSAGDVEVVTGEIETFTERGIRLKDGRELPADLVVAATGLRVRLLGGIRLDLDGEPVDPGTAVMYKGTLLAGVPNLSVTVGYDNASWTLKTEMSARFVVRVLKHLRRHGYRIAVATFPASPGRTPLLTLTSGYLTRAAGTIPSQGQHWPWRLASSYWVDALRMRLGRVNGRGLDFLR